MIAMKKARCIAVLCAAVMSLSAFAGCAAKKQDEGNETAAVLDEIPKSTVIKETDFMSFIFDEGGTNYLHMTLDELNAAEDNAYTEDNALEYDPDFGYVVYDLGELDSLFCGRAKLGGKLPVHCQLNLKDDKIIKISYAIEEAEGVDVKEVCKSLAECLAGALPEDYNAEYDRKPEGKDSAVFANTVDGYVFTVKHSDLDDNGYPVIMSIETYKDRYGME